MSIMKTQAREPFEMMLSPPLHKTPLKILVRLQSGSQDIYNIHLVNLCSAAQVKDFWGQS